MSVLTNAKMRFIFLQMAFLILFHQTEAGKKVKRDPYSVQEIDSEYASGTGGGDLAFGHSLGGLGGLEGLGGGGGGHYFQSRGLIGGGGGGYLIGHGGGLGGGGGISGGQENFAAYESLLSKLGHGSSMHDLTSEAADKIKLILLEAKEKQKMAAEKVADMRSKFGIGTFGYKGYEYPLRTEPFDLGTHHAIDLGTTLDTKSIKDSDGKLRLPVQTVVITKTLGVKVPQPYPIKHEVPIPHPYPVPVPVHYHSGDYQSSDSEGGGESYDQNISQNGGEGISNVVNYHENLAESGDKHYASSSTNYARYLPSRPVTSYAPRYHSSPKFSVFEFK